MPERFFFLVVVLILLFPGESPGQQIPVEKILKNAPTGTFSHLMLKKKNRILKFSKKISYPGSNRKISNRFNLQASQMPSLKISPFQYHFDVQKLSFFCRQEWQFEKATSIPFRFRLGSLAYTDYLEQKPNATKPR